MSELPIIRFPKVTILPVGDNAYDIEVNLSRWHEDNEGDSCEITCDHAVDDAFEWDTKDVLVCLEPDLLVTESGEVSGFVTIRNGKDSTPWRFKARLHEGVSPEDVFVRITFHHNKSYCGMTRLSLA